MQKTLVFEQKMNFFDQKSSVSAYIRCITFDAKSPYLSTFTFQKSSHFETKFTRFLSKTVKKASLFIVF